MSTATIPPNVTHLPHTAHPLPLREQAFTLHCQGLRSPAIAQELGVPERTIRAWIAAALDDLKDDLQLSRRQQLLLAVARQHQLTAVCWQQFEREAAARDALLDAALAALHATAQSTEYPITVRLPASSIAPRYLSLILQADKEANRLLGLHTLARLQLLATDAPGVEPSPLASSEIPAESATASAAAIATCSPAESATASTSRVVADLQPANTRTPHAPAPGGAALRISADSATASDLALSSSAAAASSVLNPLCSPCPSVSSVLNPRPSPAESATGIFPAPRGVEAESEVHPV